MSDGRNAIGDYAIIGDGETAALVGRDGSIDWLCLPHFDSEACFAALIGDDENGRWRVAPEHGARQTHRHYQGETLILETVFECEGGEVAVIDFMPIRGEAPDIVRIVEGRAGSVAMTSVLSPRFDYGRIRPLVKRTGEGELLAVAGPNALVLRTDATIEVENGTFTSRFTVAEGERVALAMTWFASHEPEPGAIDPPKAIDDARAFWEGWAGKLGYDGAQRPLVVRSLLTLKALTHAPTGAIVAAPTTSLPESPGGDRNWDYRYCWLRDSTFTLLSFLHAGFTEEAGAWMSWLRRSLAGEPVDVQPFYTIDGRRHAPEREAKWLSGFNGATPVRLGNAAVDQCQLDVYGEVLDALTVARRHHVDGHEVDDALFRLLVDKIETLWRNPDAGFWESRGKPKHHVYSKVMCWTAFDRAAAWFEGDAALQSHYRDLADEVKAEVMERGYDGKRNCFTRAYDNDALDASLLRLPLVGFIDAGDERMVGTVAAIEKDLLRDGFVLRYRTDQTDDGVKGAEGAFLACGFWLADNYALQGRTDEARSLFDRLCAMSNDVGLLSEEVTIDRGELLGNFPQALSHVALVNTAMNLSRKRGPAKERGGAS